MVWRLALVQLFFTLNWTVYVIYLPGLFKQAGLDASMLPWILIADQLIFAAMDFYLGLWLDRGKQLLEKFSNWLLGAVGLACVLFISLPWLANSAPPSVLVLAVLLWVIASSVLRVPPLFFMSKAVAAKQEDGKALSIGIAGYLFGIGIAGAVAPYLSITLKNIDPVLPFALAGAALLIATLALRPMLKVVSNKAEKPKLAQVLIIDFKLALPLLLAVALFAFGVQVHVALNSAKYFTAIYPAAALEWLMPLFWVGFSVAMFPASQWLKRRANSDDPMAQIASATQVIWLAGICGGAALVACVFATSLPLLIALQVAAGAAWATVMLAVFSAVNAMGKASAPSETGLWLGAALALMAMATAGRIALVLMLSNNPNLANFKLQLPWVASVFWLFAAAMAFIFARSMYRRIASDLR
jgi:MFS family permease